MQMVRTQSGFSILGMILLLVTSPAWAESADEITIQRLTWAGVKIVSGDTTLLIDAVGKDLWDGNAPGGLVPVDVETRRVYTLVTHAHNDHFDVDTLKTVLGEKGYVICSPTVYLSGPEDSLYDNLIPGKDTE